MGNHLHGKAVVQQQQLGMTNDEIRKILSRRHPVNLLKSTVAVIRAVSQLGGNTFNPAASAAGGRSGEDGFLQQPLYCVG
ncbi:hypothetical protein D3C75_1306820 [compost metagenome]